MKPGGWFVIELEIARSSVEFDSSNTQNSLARNSKTNPENGA